MPRVSEAAVTLECKLRHKYNIKDRWEQIKLPSGIGLQPVVYRLQHAML